MRFGKTRFGLVILTILLIVGLGYLLLRPLAPISAATLPLAPTPAGQIHLPWPSYGQGALGAPGYGLLATNGNQTAVPMASTAKVITALAILKQKPLQPSTQGPVITLDASAVAAYQSYSSQGGSVVPVTDGEQITEYQALQAMLIPSANNMAQSLAVWAFGSMDAYLTYANQLVQNLGMGQTHLADASGFNPATVASAQDLVKLGLAALGSPVLMQISSQVQADLPMAGTVHSTNTLLGTDGVFGIKTGNTDQAGGCYLFAASRSLVGQKVTVVGAVMGYPNLDQALADSKSLVESLNSNFEEVTVVKAGQAVGTYTAPWGSSSRALAFGNLKLLRWKGQAVEATVSLNSFEVPANSGQRTGSASISLNGQRVATPVILADPVKKPTIAWRLSHF